MDSAPAPSDRVETERRAAAFSNLARRLSAIRTPNDAAAIVVETDLQTLQDLADHCGGALDRIRAEADLRTRNQELEQRIQERTAQLEAINKELEAFSYSISHDLRAPLRSIRGFAEVLLERYAPQLDERGQEFLKRVCQSSHHMDRLIEDLLKLSRVGRAEMQSQPVDLSAIAKSIAADLRKTEPDRQAELVIAPGLRTCGDERLLRITLENLLRNAWKFTSKKSDARIEFGTVLEPQPAFFVKDNGAGFDMAYASRLFGVFQRLHSATEFPGTGVGLATVQRVVNRHGGRAWATGAVNDGATFYFTLPPCKDGL
jgi:light-regulated signal transduction histidine kinase (bacteriophytochrome)